MEFDEAHWLEAIKRPDWYLEFHDFAKKNILKPEPKTEAQKQLNKQVRSFFELALKDGRVNIGTQGYNFDDERQPVDTIVVHHTSAGPGYKLSFLNVVQLLNIYVPGFANGRERGQPIWSGHFRDNQQVFWVYHWLMRMNGSFERLLQDDQIGWHAGNWEINRRSVAICLDNDYEDQDPTDEILQKLANHIKENYPQVRVDKIIGHCEARKGTICPGTNFLGVWKPKLLKYLNDS